MLDAGQCPYPLPLHRNVLIRQVFRSSTRAGSTRKVAAAEAFGRRQGDGAPLRSQPASIAWRSIRLPSM